MNKIFKDAMIITVITLVAGCLLGAVYGITKEPIEQANYDAQQKAYKTVFEDADSFADYEGFDAAAANDVVAASEYTENTINGAVVAKDASGNDLGYVITVTSHAGYGGDITFSVGIQNDGTLNGYSVTSIAETAGLGMKATEEKFYAQFEGKAEPAYKVTKSAATADSEIESISGATITSDAITKGVNVALAYFATISEGGSGDE
jgi:electron transport complex protein RnfG